MLKSKKYISYILVVLLVLLLLFAIRVLITREQVIDQETAIEKAKLYCAQSHSPSREPEHNIEAKLLVCEDVPEKTGWNACNTDIFPPDTKVWFVSMNGLWFHQGPPNEDGSHSESILFTECKVIIDAITGDTFELGSH